MKIYKDANYSGSYFEFNTGWQNEYLTEIDLYSKTINGVYNPYLTGYDNNTSSIKIETISNCNNKYGNQTQSGVYFYSSNSYYGRCTMLPMKRQITGDENFMFASNLWNWYVGNDSINSIKIVGNYTTQIYKDAVYGGNTTEYFISSSNLPTSWEGQASSMEVYGDEDETYYFQGSLDPNKLRDLKWRWNTSNPSDWKDEAEDAVDNWNNITPAVDITETTGSGDVVVYVSDLMPTFVLNGQTYPIYGEVLPACDLGTTTLCTDREWCWVNVYTYRNYQTGWSRGEQISTLSHEFGHALSLGHGDQSDNHTRLMKQGVQSIGPQTQDVRRLNQRQGDL